MKDKSGSAIQENPKMELSIKKEKTTQPIDRKTTQMDPSRNPTELASFLTPNMSELMDKGKNTKGFIQESDIVPIEETENYIAQTNESLLQHQTAENTQTPDVHNANGHKEGSMKKVERDSINLLGFHKYNQVTKQNAEKKNEKIKEMKKQKMSTYEEETKKSKSSL